MNRQILKIALPNIISNITIPLLGLVDLALMGHLNSVDFIGAIALGGTIFNFIYWGFSFLRMGTTGITAQSYGAKDFRETILSLSRALLVAIAGSSVILLLQYPIAMLSFWLIDADNQVEALAKSYFYIRVWAAPATIGLYALMGWFIGMQNAKIPMTIAITGNIINIVLSYIFVYHFHMNEKGVALGTVLAQYSSLLLAVFFVLKYYSRLFPYWSRKGMLKIEKLKIFFMVNKDIFLRTLCLILVFTFFTTESAAYNKDILAVNTLLLQFFYIFSYFIDGFAYAAEALTGRFVGANNPKQLHKVTRLLFVWGTAIALLFTVNYALFGIDILKLLTSSLETISQSKDYLIWVIFVPVISFSSFLMDGIFVGSTASAYMRKTMMAATFLVFFPVYYLLQLFLENHALWIAMLAFLLARGAFQALVYKKAVTVSIRN